MSFDELQNKWQSHDHGRQLNLDADLLLQEVRRNHRTLESSLLYRDVVEVVAAVIVTCVFGYFAICLNEWSLYLCAFGGLFVGGFFIVDRWIQRRRRRTSDDSLQNCIRASLVQVNHQIWLLKNIIWWYLLPLGFGVIAFLASISWKMCNGGIAAQLIVLAILLGCLYAFWGVYRLNQSAVQRVFIPRREELELLLTSLDRAD